MSVLLLGFPSARASDVYVVEVAAGKTVDLYTSANISGKVFVKLGAPGNVEGCANFWWVKWPFGSVEQLGRHCGEAVFEIPGLSSLSVAAKLKVGGASTPIKVAVSANEKIAKTWTFEF